MQTNETPGSLNVPVLLYGLLFLIFFQLLSDFVESIYAFGLLGTSIPPEIASVLLFFTPVLLLIPVDTFRKWLSTGPGFILSGELFLITRLVEPLLDTQGKMLISGLGVGLFLIFFPALLWRLSRKNSPASAWALGAGLALGLSLSILSRALLSGLDLTTDRDFFWIGWLLALTAGVLLYRMHVGDRQDFIETRVVHSPRLFMQILGITSVFILIYFAFAAPNVIARWSGASYLQVVSLVVLALALFAWLLAARPQILASFSPNGLWIWNILFGFSLFLTILTHQTRFSIDPALYPLYEDPVPLLILGPRVLMLLLSPVILLDFLLLTRSLLSQRPTFRALGAGFTLASLYLLVMIFAHVFTTVYDYIPVVGPIFRNRFWLVYFLPGAVLFFTPFIIDREPSTHPLGRSRVGIVYPTLVSLSAAAAIAGVILNSPRPVPQAEGTGLRVLTYNIQQGKSAGGLKSYADQLDLLRQVDADVVGLQETDTNRISGGNSDLVRYFADRLDMYSYYGPKPVNGTFGIALLSKYPLITPHTFYMYSEGEQTAAIWAEVAIGGRRFNVFVTHLGNDGPLIQQQQFLGEASSKTDLIAMGDYNFEPEGEQYRLTRTVLEDAWLLRWPEGVDDQGYNPADRIDHIFLSPGITVAEARYLTGPQSDHPALVVDIDW